MSYNHNKTIATQIVNIQPLYTLIKHEWYQDKKIKEATRKRKKIVQDRYQFIFHI